MRELEISVAKYMELWDICKDADTDTMSVEDLIIELRAGGLAPEHEYQLVQTLMKESGQLHFTDFVTYIPLFILLHRSITANPLDDRRYI